MTLPLHKALEAVQGGTSLKVASLLHGVSVAEIEAALPEVEAQLAPGYVAPQKVESRRTRRTFEKDWSQTLVRETPLDERPLLDEREGVSRATAIPLGAMALRWGVHPSTITRKVASCEGWRRRAVLATDHERLDLSSLRARYLYWVDGHSMAAWLARVPTSPHKAQPSAYVSALLGVPSSALWTYCDRGTWRNRPLTRADRQRLGHVDPRTALLYWTTTKKAIELFETHHRRTQA